ncbi:protein of unknown function DUF214 [Hydrogenobacter thermophilus TK-6]|uniref:Putative permease n=1 Tax=Hydrogenobacter thermophilus (strain DSM 6534 / IAM 12695 / TK-6) TaxID=608538 RepID=D3DI30_HYDTT|nr:ABC transporter permease [Hydrogenobacter thermophilus]ADO45414.1 protein of unknown function DUF214 [Hydrogenobacter thermophilus TK-6]BAI69482.1 putative permease [Hydrogenobacter thermophilus TK-6]
MGKVFSIAIKDILNRPTTLYVSLVILLIINLVSITIGVSLKVKESTINTLTKLGYTFSVYPKNFTPSNVEEIGFVKLKKINDTTIDYTKDAFIPRESVDKIYNLIKKYDNNALLLPRLYVRVNVLYKRIPLNLTLAGVDFNIERKARPFLGLIAGSLPANKENILIGAAVAKKISVNDNLVIMGKTFTVSGIYEYTGTIDDFLVFVDLHELQSLYNTYQLSLINVSSSKLDATPNLLNELISRIENTIPNVKIVVPKQLAELKIKFIDKIILITIVSCLVLIPLGIIFLYISVYFDIKAKERTINVLSIFWGYNRHIGTFLLIQYGMITLISMILALLTSYIGKILITKNILNMVIVRLEFSDLQLIIAVAVISILIIVLIVSLHYKAKKEVKFYG